MKSTNKKSQYILWAVALLAVFAVITLVGTKVFYGIIVPQAQAVNQLGIFIVLGFSFIARRAAFFAPWPVASLALLPGVRTSSKVRRHTVITDPKSALSAPNSPCLCSAA